MTSFMIYYVINLDIYTSITSVFSLAMGFSKDNPQKYKNCNYLNPCHNYKNEVVIRSFTEQSFTDH